MRSSLSLIALAVAAAPAFAQNSLIFTGRFPFKGLDAVNERVGGSINALDEFDFSAVTPGVGAVAKSLQPATAHQAYFGDANADGNFTKFFGFKTYFQNIQMGGVFVKNADKASPRHDKVFFTVRSNAAPLQFEAFTNNGTAVAVLRPGDFVRFTGNGNLEFFVTQDQLDIAAGPPSPTGVSAKGASAMCQDAAGNLYYSPASGGHWLNWTTPQVFANDGAIVQIDAANITYDANGNVAAIAPNCARLLIEEVTAGTSPNPLSLRQMATNSGAQDRTGAPIVIAGIFGKVSGLDFDPNGGTWTARWPDSLGNYTTAPNFVFTSDAGSYGGTIFSTAPNPATLAIGSVAVINGVLCGSVTGGVPANGSWLGVQLDVANSQPSLMGLCVTGALGFEPAVLDMPNFGAVLPTQPTIDIDMHGLPIQAALLFADFPPFAYAPSVSSTLLPFVLGAGCYQQTFPIVAPMELGFFLTDINGYATTSVPNPNTGALTGLPVVLQAGMLDFATNQVAVTTPVLMQFK